METTTTEKKGKRKKMKNIFKKLHLGTTNTGITPSSLSTATTTTPTTSASSVQSPAPISPITTNNGTNNSNLAAASDVSGANRSDFFTSEEEFQVQLALAISASNSEKVFRDDRRHRDDDKDQILAATLLSLEGDIMNQRRRQADEAAELLSRRYWDYNVLDYDEKVVDGFYDLFGLSMDPARQGKMPSLADLQTTGDPRFEAVVVNRGIDPALEELHQIAQCIALDCPTSDISLLVQGLADLVTEHFGGPVTDANIMLAAWMEQTVDFRTSRQTNILPIGSLNIGLSRHRSLLFKVLADDVGISCRLVKGSHYTGNDDDVINIIKVENEREFLVDLMAAPGTLIPAEVLNTKDTPINSNNPRGKSPNLPTDPSLDVDLLGLDVENNMLLNGNSSSERTGLVTSISISSNGKLPISFSSNFNETSVSGTPGSSNQSHPSSSSRIESSSQQKENQGSPVVDVTKASLGVVPNSPDTRKESEIIFADLNPFQMIGSGKSHMQNRNTNNKVNDFPKKIENLAPGPGRPPSPLNWKNRPTCNEVPRTKQYEFVEELLPRKNHEVKHYNASSLASSSSNSSDKVYPEVHNVNVGDSRVSYPGKSSIGNKHYSGGGDSELTLSTDQHTRLEENGCQTAKPDFGIQSPDTNLQGDFYRDGGVFQNGMVNNSMNRRNSSDDIFVYSKKMSRYADKLGSQVGAGPSKLDPMLDDVAECEIPWEDIVIGERIGLGSYGEVFRADWKGTEVAVKKFLDQDFSGDALAEFRSEVRIMRRLRHPNVVLFLGAVTRPPNLSIISEFLPRGSLYRILHRPHSQIDESHRIKMALDVAKGMNCLHTSTPTVVHRDLKSQNLLVDNDWNVKVCDFGLSRLKHNTFLSSKSTAGTPEWMAPEVLRNEQSNEKCDVYSFGVILWELATLRKPWTGLNPMQVVGAVGFQNRRLEIPKEVDPLVSRIIWECWQTDPNLRPSFAQLTVTLKPLQRLLIAPEQEQASLHLPSEISVNSTP